MSDEEQPDLGTQRSTSTGVTENHDSAPEASSSAATASVERSTDNGINSSTDISRLHNSAGLRSPAATGSSPVSRKTAFNDKQREEFHQRHKRQQQQIAQVNAPWAEDRAAGQEAQALSPQVIGSAELHGGAGAGPGEQAGWVGDTSLPAHARGGGTAFDFSATAKTNSVHTQNDAEEVQAQLTAVEQNLKKATKAMVASRGQFLQTSRLRDIVVSLRKKGLELRAELMRRKEAAPYRGLRATGSRRLRAKDGKPTKQRRGSVLRRGAPSLNEQERMKQELIARVTKNARVAGKDIHGRWEAAAGARDRRSSPIGHGKSCQPGPSVPRTFETAQPADKHGRHIERRGIRQFHLWQ
eukprot:INCI561.2.p1 GENE.INCI561.2~~INCI561.2.p1  ORF type:complete len:400 (+),score=58.67 INCI561.2:136-1200(+)